MSSTLSTPMRRRGAHPGIERRRDAGRRVRRHVRPDAAVARSHAESGHETVRESGVGMHHRRFMSGENRHGRTLGHRTRVAVHREAARHSPGNRRRAMQPVIAKPGSEHVGRRLGQAGRRRSSIARLPRCVRRPKLSCRLAAAPPHVPQSRKRNGLNARNGRNKRHRRRDRHKQRNRCSRFARRTPQSACRLPPAACRLPPIACRLPPIACRLSPAACRLSPAVCRLSHATIHDQRPAISDPRPAHPRTRDRVMRSRRPATRRGAFARCRSAVPSRP
nr:putative lipo domain protein [Burkholderia pseudomallei]